jgi:hypothetical protein
MKKLILMAGAALMVNMSAQATDWLTEYFYGNFDLNGVSLTFTPDGTDNYTVSAETITELPVDLLAGTSDIGLVDYVIFSSTWEPHSLTIPNGGRFTFFGEQYSTVWLSGRGVINFGTQDRWLYPSLSDHYLYPGISLFFQYLNPTEGKISYVRTANPDRFVITFEDVPGYYTGDTEKTCTAQCEMYLADGTIKLSWIDCAEDFSYNYTYVGLSAGQGEGGFIPTDFSALLGPVVPPNDADEDNIPDTWETAHFGSYTNCTAGDDSDLDGFSNYNEYIANTDPTDEDSHFQIQSAYLTGAAAPEFVLNWNCQTGRTYSVLWSANPSTGFTPVNTTGITHPQSSFSAPVTGQQGFYKVEVHMTE